jgi:uncharacterized protein (TIGR03435 family)
MLQALLARRFQLKVHIDTEQVPAYALTVGKRGLKIRPVQEGACERLLAPTPGVPMRVQRRSFADVRRGEKPSCGLNLQSNGSNMVFVAGEVPLEALVGLLGVSLGQRVIDKTDNADKFNFLLEFANDENTPGASRFLGPSETEPSDIPRAATIYTALEEQLGLRLEPAKASREFIVIDHLERLSPN